MNRSGIHMYTPAVLTLRPGIPEQVIHSTPELHTTHVAGVYHPQSERREKHTAGAATFAKVCAARISLPQATIGKNCLA